MHAIVGVAGPDGAGHGDIAGAGAVITGFAFDASNCLVVNCIRLVVSSVGAEMARRM